MKWTPLLSLSLASLMLGAAANPAAAQFGVRNHQPPVPSAHNPWNQGRWPGHSSYHRPAYGACPIVGLADQLILQADEFLIAFAPSAHLVPQGNRFLNDTRRLGDAALQLRIEAERGAPPARLASLSRRVDSRWRQLESRMFRVSRGQIGPNIAIALQMGATVEQLRRHTG